MYSSPDIFTARNTLGHALIETATLGLQSHFRDKPFKFQVLCPQNGASAKGDVRLSPHVRTEKYVSIVVVLIQSCQVRGFMFGAYT